MLKERLLHIAKYVPLGARVADIGCDHAYLAIYLVQNKIAESVLACDIVEGPLEAARKNVELSGTQTSISVRQSDGLEKIQPQEIDCVVIAGMGASTIIEILQLGQAVTASCERLILQPMVGSELLREYLYQNGWQIVHEDLCVDNERLYEIIVAEVATPKSSYHAEDIYIGKLHQHPLFARYLAGLIAKQEYLLQALKLAKDERAVADKIVTTQELLALLKAQEGKI